MSNEEEEEEEEELPRTAIKKTFQQFKKFLTNPALKFDSLTHSVALILLLSFAKISENDSAFTLNNKTYVDENGLLLGATVQKFDEQCAMRAKRISNELLSSIDADLDDVVADDDDDDDGMYRSQMAKIEGILRNEKGVDFTKRSYAMHAVARAKFGDGRESIAIVVPVGCSSSSSSSRDGRVGEDEVDALALAMEVFFYVQSEEVKWLGRDIVLVIPTCLSYDSDSNNNNNTIKMTALEATQRWVDAYLEGEEEMEKGNEDVFFRAGQIHQAFGFETPSGLRKYSKLQSEIFVKLHGWNGALPNQDMFEVAKFSARSGSGIFANEKFSVHGTHKVDKNKLSSNSFAKWMEYTKAWISFAKLSVIGVPTGVHGAFKSKSIDSFTLVYDGEYAAKVNNNKREDDDSFSKKQQQQQQQQRRDYRLENYLVCGIALETAIRACNNLVEQLHHSRFEYVLIGNDRYVGVAELAGTLGVMLVALGIKQLKAYDSEKQKEMMTIFSAMKIFIHSFLMVVLIALAYFNISLALCLATFFVPVCLLLPNNKSRDDKRRSEKKNKRE